MFALEVDGIMLNLGREDDKVRRVGRREGGRSFYSSSVLVCRLRGLRNCCINTKASGIFQ